MADERGVIEDIENLEILEYIERRQRLVYPDRINDLDSMDNVDFQSRYRLSKSTVETLIRMLGDTLSSDTDKNYALSPTEKICIALRYFATGSLQTILGDLAGVSQPSANRAINQVAEALAELRPDYIQLPQTESERRQISRQFFLQSGFPGVIGEIDGTLIKIKSPGRDSAETFRSRKGLFSLNVQTVSDPSLYIRDIVACWQGSTHDSTIFDNSHVRAVMETDVPPYYHLLGDRYCIKD